MKGDHMDSLEAENMELRRLLRLLVPSNWEHNEERPGLRRTYETCDQILGESDERFPKVVPIETLREAIIIIEHLADQQAMSDDSYVDGLVKLQLLVGECRHHRQRFDEERRICKDCGEGSWICPN